MEVNNQCQIFILTLIAQMNSAKIMNEANGLKNQTINKAANDNLLSATKNVARYYKKRSRY